MTAWLIPNGLFTTNSVLSLSARISTLSSFFLVVILNLDGASLSPAKARTATRRGGHAFMGFRWAGLWSRRLKASHDDADVVLAAEFVGLRYETFASRSWLVIGLKNSGDAVVGDHFR